MSKSNKSLANGNDRAVLGYDDAPCNKISKDELIEELKKLADQLGHSPSRREMNDHGGYSGKTYQNRFGSWNKAKDIAGLGKNSCGDGVVKNKIPKDALREELARLKEKIGAPPRMEDMKKMGKYSATTYQNRIGTWDDVLKWAGFDPKNKEISYSRDTRPRYSNEELLEEIRDLQDKLDRVPSSYDMKKHGGVSDAIYIKRFGGWKCAVYMAGLNPGEIEDRRSDKRSESVREQISQTKTTGVCEMLNDLQIAKLQAKFSESHSLPLKRKNMSELGRKHPMTYTNYFGSWRKAKFSSGFSEIRPGKVYFESSKNTPRKLYSSLDVSVGDLVSDMVDVAVMVGRPPRQKDVKEYGNQSVYTYLRNFGTWTEALSLCGFFKRYRNNRKSKEGGYGENWGEQRLKALDRDRFICQHCGMDNGTHNEKFNQSLHVHHIVPICNFPADQRKYANILANLITLCRNCHVEWGQRRPNVTADEIIQLAKDEFSSSNLPHKHSIDD